MEFRKTTIYLIVLTLIVMCLLAYGERKRGKEEGANLKKWEELLNIDVNQIEAVVLTKGHWTLQILNKSGRWIANSGNNVQVDGGEIDNLLRVFRYGFVRVFEAVSRSSLKEYGLGKPEIVFRIRLNGSSEKALSIGKNHVGGLTCYAKRNDMTKIFLVGLAYKQEFTKFIERYMVVAQ